jgi:hypothetical protein
MAAAAAPTGTSVKQKSLEKGLLMSRFRRGRRPSGISRTRPVPAQVFQVRRAGTESITIQSQTELLASRLSATRTLTAVVIKTSRQQAVPYQMIFDASKALLTVAWLCQLKTGHRPRIRLRCWWLLRMFLSVSAIVGTSDLWRCRKCVQAAAAFRASVRYITFRAGIG